MKQDLRNRQPSARKGRVNALAHKNVNETPGSSAKKTILIADDSAIMLKVVSTLLNELGYEALEFRDGESLWNHLTSAKELPAACLLDQNMPGLSGLALCRRIRANPKFAKLAVLMLTAESDSEARKQGEELQVLAWLLKPFRKDTLAQLLKITLEKAAG
jgi:CheY-like chemotaxis protein